METIKVHIVLAIRIFSIASCTTIIENDSTEQQPHPIIGTWKLISGTTIKGQDTIIVDYTKDQEMIKIINDSHFAFLRHDLEKGKGDNAIFVAGGGRYTLNGNKYTEHLAYLNFREWEGNSFELEYSIMGDTLITSGIEEIEELDIDQINIEKFVRLKD